MIGAWGTIMAESAADHNGDVTSRLKEMLVSCDVSMSADLAVICNDSRRLTTRDPARSRDLPAKLS